MNGVPNHHDCESQIAEASKGFRQAFVVAHQAAKIQLLVESWKAGEPMTRPLVFHSSLPCRCSRSSNHILHRDGQQSEGRRERRRDVARPLMPALHVCNHLLMNFIIAPFLKLLDLFFHPIGGLAGLTVVFIEKTPIYGTGRYLFIWNGYCKKFCPLRINAWTIWRDAFLLIFVARFANEIIGLRRGRFNESYHTVITRAIAARRNSRNAMRVIAPPKCQPAAMLPRTVIPFVNHALKRDAVIVNRPFITKQFID